MNFSMREFRPNKTLAPCQSVETLDWIHVRHFDKTSYRHIDIIKNVEGRKHHADTNRNLYQLQKDTTEETLSQATQQWSFGAWKAL